MKVTIRSRAVFDVTFPDGHKETMEQAGQEWQGMVAMKGKSGTLVVDQSEDWLARIVGLDREHEAVVVKCSPAIAERVKLPDPPPDGHYPPAPKAPPRAPNPAPPEDIGGLHKSSL